LVILLSRKEPDHLEDFIKKYETSAIEGFIEGIKKDIAPVNNAISLDVSSGFVEGNNNKFKLIKRILYGRADLVNLFKKSYIAFQSKLDNFKLLQLTQVDAVK
jgi:transposase